MKGLKIFILKCSSMVSAATFAVCLCCSDIRGFATVISFSAAMDDALSNKRLGDSLQYLPISPIVSTKSIVSISNHKQLPGVQPTKAV